MPVTLALCKQRLPLPELLARLGLFDAPPRSGNHPCPIHSERNGSAFSMQHTRGVWLWICHGKCAAGGDEISFLEHFGSLSRRNAIHRYQELCGFSPRNGFHPNPIATHRKPAATQVPHPMIDFPNPLTAGSFSDCEQVANLRSVPTSTITAMSKEGLLAFGNVCGLPSWLVLDGSRKLAEARRMDGERYPCAKSLGERKTHTLRGSQKNWPLGLREGTAPILLVEGSGDFVAAHYFCSFTKRSATPWQPVAMLGASVKTLHPDAIPLLSGRRVRIVPHADEAGAKAGLQWAKLLGSLQCQVDGFDLSRLTKNDGSPVSDLNDCTTLLPGQEPELTQLFL